MNFANVIMLISGVWMIVNSFAQSTENFGSALIYKIIPFFLGTGCFISGCKMMGWI